MQPKRFLKNEYLGRGMHVHANRRRATSIGLHSHDYFELEIVLSGNGYQNVNSEKYILERGSVYLLNPTATQSHLKSYLMVS